MIVKPVVGAAREQQHKYLNCIPDRIQNAAGLMQRDQEWLSI